MPHLLGYVPFKAAEYLPRYYQEAVLILCNNETLLFDIHLVYQNLNSKHIALDLL